MTVTVRKGNDPFKKYWWVILLAFGAIGCWVCLPMMDTSIGSGSAVREHGLKSENQSLDSMNNPSGAPGSAVDLSMDGATRKKKLEDPSISHLYEPPPEAAAPVGAAAPGAPIAPGSASASFADALREVSRKSDAKGWGGATPQKGFTPPKANFSGLSGFGSAGSGGSGASVSAGAFGTAVAKTAFATTRGLSGTDESQGSKGTPVMDSLKAAKSQGQAANIAKSADLARSLSGARFDGSGGGSAISGDGAQSVGGSYSGLDAVPANLKPNDEDANAFKQEIVPAAVAPMDTSDEQKRQLVIALAGALIGGMIGGTAGNLIGMAIMMSATMGRSQNSGSNVSGQTSKKTTFYVPVRRPYGPATQYS